MVFLAFWVLTLTVFATMSDAYYPMVIAYPGTCAHQRLASGIVVTTDDSCGDLGKRSLVPGRAQLADGNVRILLCDVDVCFVPDSGRIATQDVWGIAAIGSKDSDRGEKKVHSTPPSHCWYW